MDAFRSLLDKNVGLQTARCRSQSLLARVDTELLRDSRTTTPVNASAFVVGSLARLEAGELSDVDLYLVSDGELTDDDAKSAFTSYAEALAASECRTVHLDENCLKAFSAETLCRSIGRANDDFSNALTVRMLLLLEGRPISKKDIFSAAVTRLAEEYFGHATPRDPAFPAALFLDDILRFWRTLCVNYDVTARHASKPVRLKRLSLRYSKALTVFSTVAAVVTTPDFAARDVAALMPLTPLQRLARSLDEISDLSLLADFSQLLEYHCAFLELKQEANAEQMLRIDEALDTVFLKRGNFLVKFIFDVLSSNRIDALARQHLLI